MFSSNSTLLAFSSLSTFLANSTTIHCSPRHIPKQGISLSLANLTALILPSTPLSPNPPGIRIPSTSSKYSSGLTPFSSFFSASIRLTLTLSLLAIPPPCIRASLILIYASLRSTYLPTRAIVTSPSGFF